MIPRLHDLERAFLDPMGWPLDDAVPYGNQLKAGLHDSEADAPPSFWYGMMEMRLLDAYPNWRLVGARSDACGLLQAVVIDRNVDSEVGGDLVMAASYTPPGNIARHTEAVLLLMISRKRPSGKRRFIIKTIADLEQDANPRSLSYLRLLQFCFTDLQREAVCSAWI